MLTREFTSKNLNLDAWGGAYVGAHWLVTNELPDKHWEADVRHHALAQLVVVASHHLVEVMLFKVLEEKLESSPDQYLDERKKFKRATFGSVKDKWSGDILDGGLEWEAEPFKSAIKLSQRRNATIHKQAALATLEMARSALFTAVETSKAIDKHFNEHRPFRYAQVLEKYPVKVEPMFSELEFPERAGEKKMQHSSSADGGRGNDAKPKQ
jgi:hypothetical protein